MKQAADEETRKRYETEATLDILKSLLKTYDLFSHRTEDPNLHLTVATINRYVDVAYLNGYFREKEYGSIGQQDFHRLLEPLVKQGYIKKVQLAQFDGSVRFIGYSPNSEKRAELDEIVESEDLPYEIPPSESLRPQNL